MLKDVRLNFTYSFIVRILNKIEFQQIGLNHSSDINFKDFVKIYEKYTVEPHSFLVNDTTLRSDNPSRFKKNSFKSNIYNLHREKNLKNKQKNKFKI